MATPRVFVSSTCFDLGEIRDQLSRFIKAYGFEPVLSERGDVFYHPDLHTHEACIHEVANCQLFIVIIGGRFGGEYINDKTKSITNAEHDAAKQCGLPVFAYVRSAVLSQQIIYKRNKNKTFASEIEYPAIDKQEHAENIFEFIEQVRRSSVNNAMEPFDNFLDIEIHLRKQWAGMFFDYLKTREMRIQIDATNHLLTIIRSSSGKLEELVKSLYRSVAQDTAEKSIESVEVLESTRLFFEAMLDDHCDMGTGKFGNSSEFDVDEIAKITPIGKTWYEYLHDIKLFEYKDGQNTVGEDDVIGELDALYGNKNFGFYITPANHQDKITYFENGVKMSTEEQRRKVLSEFVSLK